ncbi:MAG: MerR family transcriptional regulator [Fibrobacterota bacterium]|nr:MerR family transcriptional regulator [Fibrobacterota bacterium]QQS03960.1 MAG: MerR family transcriptional regulator [Fibrobacterota bacterium]
MQPGPSVSEESKSSWTTQEICQAVGLEAHVLRYWESEFTQLRPRKGRSGERLYREREVHLVRRIRELLYEEHLTIQAARRKLAEEARRTENPGQLGMLLTDPEPSDEADGPEDFDRQAVVEGLREVLDLLRYGRRSW